MFEKGTTKVRKRRSNNTLKDNNTFCSMTLSKYSSNSIQNNMELPLLIPSSFESISGPYLSSFSVKGGNRDVQSLYVVRAATVSLDCGFKGFVHRCSTIITLGLLPHWFQEAFSRLRYSTCSLASATHCRLFLSNCTSTIVPLHSMQISPSGALKNLVLPATFPEFLSSRRLCTVYYFIWKSRRYWTEPLAFSSFVLLESNVMSVPLRSVRSTLGDGVCSGPMLHQKRLLFGPCSTDIPVSSVWRLFVNEVMHPFYVFQIASIALWLWDDYVEYAVAILLTMILSSGYEIVETMSSELQLRNLSRLHGRVQILRRSSTHDHPAEDLVPGDVFEVHKGMVLPCDAVLLDGAVVVDESQLTGESVAIPKQAVCRKSDRLFDWDADVSSVLYSGTKLLDVKSKQHQSQSYAICGRTGFDTLRGSMVYSIMFPPSSRYDFESDVFRFVQVLACGATVVAALTFVKEYLKKKTWKEIVIMSLDPVTCVVPPALPAAITGALSLSLARLRSKWDVRCVHPKHIMSAGQVSTVVFDKTGTLTEEGIHYYGVIPVLHPPFAMSCKTLRNDTVASSVHLPARIEALKPQGLGTIETDVISLEVANPMLLMAMATCHELSIVQGDLQGDDHDRCLFAASGWEIAEEGHCTADVNAVPGVKELFLAPPKTEWFVSMRPRGRQRLVTMIAEGVNLDDLADTMTGRRRCPAFESMRLSRSVEMGRLRVYSLDHSLHRMTVVVRDLFTKQCFCFVKGAPESILDICLPSSVPELTETTIQSYASRGARLLGLAGRPLGPLTPSAVDRLARVDLEHKLVFLGLGIFENKPKEGVKEALLALHEAHVRPLMATGDNPRTAIAVSRQTCLLPSCVEDVIIGDLHAVHSDRVVWAKVAYAPNDGSSSDSDWLNTALRHRHTTFDLQDYIVGQQLSTLTVVLTGRAFRKVQEWHLRLGLAFHGDERWSQPLRTAASVHSQDSVSYLAAKHMLPPAVSEWMTISCARNRRRLRSHELVEEDDLVTISLFEFILRHGQVFSRMTPDDKALLVTSLQSLPRSPLVGMVGDGANDCAALKVADLSVSVGSAETSLAASFTSEKASLRSVLDVMREGRAALANGFVQVRFVLLYSMMQYAMCEILFFNGTYITDQMVGRGL